MKKTILLFFTIGIGVLYAQNAKVVNAENVETRTITSFTGISVSNGIELLLTNDNTEAVAVGANEIKYRDRIKTEVKDGILKIWYENEDKILKWGNDKKKGLKAFVSYKSLEKLNISSGASVTHNNIFKGNSLVLKLSSGGTLNCELSFTSLVTDLSSGAVANVSGKADNIIISAGSGANFKGYNLVTNNCTAKASSGAGIKINVSNELIAKASSGGGIQYKGSGVIKEVSTGSGGSVKKVVD
jgi:hypothetical protein